MNRISKLKLSVVKKIIAIDLSILDVWILVSATFLIVPLTATLIPTIGIDVGNYYLSFLVVLVCISICMIYIVTQLKRFKRPLRPNLIIIFLIIVTLIVGYWRATAVFSILPDFIAPILHDPLAHSLWAKSIVIEDKINFFYSPLLHAISAMLSFGDIWKIPKALFFTTQLAVFVLPIMFSALFYYFKKNLGLSIIVFVTLSSLYFPASLYYTAGKNSLILGISLIPSATYTLHKYFHKPTRFGFFTVFLSLTLLFLAHYPTFGIFFYLITPWLIIKSINSLRDRKYKHLFLKYLPIILSITFSALWFSVFLYIRNAQVEESLQGKPIETTPLSLRYLAVTLKDAYNNFAVTKYKFLHLFLIIPMLVGKNKLIYSTSIIWGYFSLIVFQYIIKISGLQAELNILSSTLSIIYPSLIYLFLLFTVVWLFLKLGITNKSLVIVLVFVSLISVNTNIRLAQDIIAKHESLIVVDQHDLDAFEYINNNVPAGSGFVNGGQEHARRKNLIFPVDGGLWLPVFTDSQQFIEFIAFSDRENIRNYNLFTQILEQPDDSGVIEEIKSLGYEYGYIDQSVFGQSLAIDFLNNVEYDVLFESGTVQIIKFK